MQIVVIGGGGAGREMLDVIEAVNAAGSGSIEVLGVLDDGRPDVAKLAPYGLEHIGPVGRLESLPPQVGFLVGIGAPAARTRIDALGAGRSCPVVVHPTAVLAREVTLGPGTLVAAHATLMNHVATGRHVHISVSCSIGHDVRLGDYVEVSPTTALSGYVSAGSAAFFGTGAKVNPGIVIGSRAIVGSGAVVTRDVDPGSTVVGVPARAIEIRAGAGAAKPRSL